MTGANALQVIYLVLLVAACCAASETLNSAPPQSEGALQVKKIKVSDDVFVEVPMKNDTDKLFSLEIQTNGESQTGRGKKSNLMQKILPMFIIPFIIQSTIVPLFLGMLKFMLVKSLLVGKLALSLILFNAFRNNNSFRHRRDAEMADSHYGYHGNGMEEYGAYIN